MRRGTVSYSKVRAVTRVATPETEDDLLNVALSGTASHVEKIVRGWRRADRAAEEAEDRRRHETRSVRTWVDEDGMVVVRGRLTPEVGAVLRRALEAACDQARGADAPDPDAGGDAACRDAADVPAPSLAQRQADALGVIAECALAGGLDRGTAGDRYQVVVHVDADALTKQRDVLAETPATTASGSEPRDRSPDVPSATPATAASESERRDSGPRVPAETPAAALPGPNRPGVGSETRAGAARRAADGGRTHRSRHPCPGPRPAAPTPAARGQTVLDEAGGIHVSAETARRLACDAAVIGMRHGSAGEILDVGRRTRTISPALRRALRARDQQCRFPGCRNRRCDGHHIRHWADGGATALDNLVLLCRRHHRAVHEEGLHITLDATGEVQFVRPDGRPLPEAPAAPVWTGSPLAPVTARLERDGVTIGPDTATPDWRGERLDLDWVIHVLWRPRTEAEATRAKQAPDRP